MNSPWKAKQSDSASVELLFKMPAFLNPATEFAHCKKCNQRKLAPNYETKVQKCLEKKKDNIRQNCQQHLLCLEKSAHMSFGMETLKKISQIQQSKPDTFTKLTNSEKRNLTDLEK